MYSCTMPVADPEGEGRWGARAPPPPPEGVVSVLFFCALYDIASKNGNGFGCLGVFWGVSMDATTVMITVKWKSNLQTSFHGQR